jgi:hypothetical protein
MASEHPIGRQIGTALVVGFLMGLTTAVLFFVLVGGRL